MKHELSNRLGFLGPVIEHDCTALDEDVKIVTSQFFKKS